MSAEENSPYSSPDTDNQQKLLKNISTGGDLTTGDITQNNAQFNIYITSENTNQSTDSSTANLPIEELVRQVRQKNRDRIQRLHGTIQLLDVANPVEIDRLYVDVNVLSEPTSYNHLEIDDFLQNSFQKTDLDRLGLPNVQKRISGIKAVEDYQKLMVLGKPGAGKSTFLQHVVIECNNGNLLSDRVPILIKLRDYVRKARREEDFNLKLHICSYLQGCSQQKVEALMEEGKILLLLDGLDEIPEVDVDKVIDEINWFIDEYTLNHIIITCRLQGQKYKFNDFTYLEIADFNENQIIAFAEKWFAASYNNHVEKGKAKAQKFISQLKLPEHKQILELVTTPLLLSLVCKVFSVKHQFYSKRHELYEQGLEILLSKWDESRRIKRDRIYQNLTLAEKQKLLSYIAASKFKQEQYVLFEKKEIQRYIAEYLEDISEEDSQRVLESIIVQHGLLIERAQRIYSFSHLTFQEYFAAKWFQNYDDWKKLIDYIAKKRCRELFFLFVEMIDNKEDADDFLLFCKEKIDKIIALDEKTQKFLAWIERKSSLVNISYKSAAVRAFYLKSNRCSEFSPGNDLACAIDVNLKNDCNSEKFQGININIITMQMTFPSPPNTELYLDDNLDAILANCLESSPDFFTLVFLGSGVSTNDDFDWLLSNLLNQLPEYLTFDDWWREKGSKWTEQLRNLSLKYRLIGRDWQFSEEQKELLMQYYDANKLLVDCLNSCSVVSDEVRKKIEETLLLPIAGVKRREESES